MLCLCFVCGSCVWLLFVDVVSVILFSCGSCVCDFVNFVFEIVLFVNVVCDSPF